MFSCKLSTRAWGLQSSEGPPEFTCLEHGNGIVFVLSGARDSLSGPAACPCAYTSHALSFSSSVVPWCGIVGHRGHFSSSLLSTLVVLVLSAQFHTTLYFPCVLAFLALCLPPWYTHDLLRFVFRWIRNSRPAHGIASSREYVHENYLHGAQTRRRRRRRRLSVSQLIRPTSDPSYSAPSDPRRFPERVWLSAPWRYYYHG